MSHDKLNLMPEKKAAIDTFKDEREMRMQNRAFRFTTGIYYFDDAIGGIYRNDVLIIGAKSGKGKTEVAVTIAEKNARMGHKVVYFALEAEPHEVTRRIKYRYLSRYYFANRNQFLDVPYLRYADWYYGNYGDKLAAAEDHAESVMSKFMGNLTIIYRESSKYTVQDFTRMFYSLQNEADIFIVDHIHYFDSDEPNENKALKETMMALRDCALRGGRAMVLVAHMRKSERASKQIMPDLEDFHGSSDIGKIATKAITIAPARGLMSDGTKFPTYLKVLKSRVGSDVENYAALCNFDITTNSYEDRYVVGTANFDTFEELGASITPRWAQQIIIQNEFGKAVGVSRYGKTKFE